MKLYNTVLFLLFPLMGLASACYSHEELSVEPGKPKFKIEDSTDPVDHEIYEIHKKTGVQILYDYKPNDYRWNLGAVQTTSDFDTVMLPKEREALALGMKYVNTTLLRHYSEDFKRHFFPLRIFLADSIYHRARKKEIMVAPGRDHILIGNINKSILEKITPKQLKERQGILNATLWSKFFLEKEGVEFPPAFGTLSQDYYNHFLNKPPLKTMDPREMGFWGKIQNTMDIYPRTPKDEKEDVFFFIQKMTSFDKETLDQQMKGFPVLIEKYNILRKYLIEVHKIDLQEIGNSEPPSL